MAKRRTDRLTSAEARRIVANYQRHYAEDHGFPLADGYRANMLRHEAAHGVVRPGSAWHTSHDAAGSDLGSEAERSGD